MVSHDVGSDDAFTLLLCTLRKSKPLLCESTVNLMNEILSRENYIDLAVQLNCVSDAQNLLDFRQQWLYSSLSNQDPVIMDMNRRARRFMLAVISRIHDVPLSNIPYDPDDYMLPLLVSILSRNKPGIYVVHLMTTGLMNEIILSTEDYISLAAKINQPSDSINLLESLHYLPSYGYLLSRDAVTTDMNRRARRFMSAVITNMQSNPHCNILPSLLSILNNVLEPGYSLETNELAVNLMSEIVSREDIFSEPEIHHNSDSRDLFMFIWHRLHYNSSSKYQNSDNADLKGRRNRIMLEFIAKTRGISLPNFNTPHNPHTRIFQLITAVLDSEPPPFIQPEDLDGVLIDLILEILSQDYYKDIVAQLNHTTNAKHLLDFVLRNIFFRDFDNADMTHRASLFLLKIMSKTDVEPHPLNPDDPENCSFPLLLQILNYCSPWLDVVIVHTVTIDLIRLILSKEDYINTVAQLNQVSDAINLLDFLLAMLLDDFPFSDSTMNWRGRRFMLEVFSKTDMIIPSLNMPYADPDSYALPLLLYILKHAYMELVSLSGTSVLGTTIVDLMCDILSREDYVDLVTQIDNPLDAGKLLDFILDMLLNRRISSRDSTTAADITRRAQRFMLKIISKIPIVPPSLIVTGVSIPVDRNYIGGGGFGRVFRGERGGEVVALKVLYKSENQVAFCREALMWRSLDHKFVLPFLGIHEIRDTTVPQFFLVSPYMKNGTLAQWRKQANPPKSIIEHCILEVAQAMEYIHSAGAVHGDLRGENVLLDDNFHVQIADFGLTRLSEATNTRSGALHLHFAAPELFGQESEDDEGSSDDTPSRTQMSDVYGFGCLYYEIHYDNIPFSGKSDLQVLSLVSRGVRPPRLAEQPLSDGRWDVIQRCWAHEPLKRPRMKCIVESMIAMSQAVSPQINADGKGLREALQSSSTPNSTTLHLAPQKRKHVHDKPDNDVTSTSGITPPPDRKRRRHDSESECSLLHAID